MLDDHPHVDFPPQFFQEKNREQPILELNYVTLDQNDRRHAVFRDFDYAP
jgi:hypothetical protein